MAYIGRDIEYGSFTKQVLTANSTTTVFALDQSVFDANSLLVSVGGVIQEPDEAYTASGTTLTFSEAPTTGDPIWIVYLGKNLGLSTTRGAITYQAATGDGSATTVAMTSSGNTGNIVVTLNGVAQTPSTDFSVSGSTLTFTTAPFNGAAIGIHYLGKQARLGVPSSGSIVQADLANSGTLPAWDGSALTGIAGITKADVFELQNNIALLNFLRANDITAKRTSMLNGFQDQFRTEDGIDAAGSSQLTYSNNTYTNSEELTDSYGKELMTSNTNLYDSNKEELGQAITLSSPTTLTKIGLPLSKSNSPTGNAQIYIYSLTGTVGTNAEPDNTVLAISDTLDVSTLGFTTEVVYFNFPDTPILSGDIGIALRFGGGGGIHLINWRRQTSTSGKNQFYRNTIGSGSWTVITTTMNAYYLYGTKNLEIMTKGTDDLSEVSSPSSAPSKGHIEALVNDQITTGEETITSSASLWSGNGTSHVTFSGSDIKVNTGDKSLWVPDAITGNFEVTGTWYGSTGTNSTGQSVNRGFALGFFASSETYVEGALNTNNMSQIWYYDAPNQGSGAGDSFGYGQASQGTFTPTNGDTFKFCRIGGTFYWYFADVLRHTWSQTYTGTGHIILNWSGVTNIEIINLQWVTNQGTSPTYPTLNTDIVGEMSRDGGTTWSPSTLRRVDKVIAGSNYDVFMGDVDFTGDPSGTNIKGRIKTVNKHKVTVKGMAVNWQ